MRALAVVVVMLVVAVCGTVFAGGAPEYVISAFDDAADMKGWDQGDSGNVELSIGPRTPTEMNNMLKMAVVKGQYPGFTAYSPKIPKDWMPYDTFSFVVWSPSDTAVAIRIDDEKSFNYNTRYNGGVNIQKGRSLVQIPIKDIAKSIDPSKVKMLVIFTVDPPPGQTLWFDDFKLGPVQSAKVDFIPYEERYDLISSMELVSPHFPMARPLAGGPVKTFMLTSVRFGREVVEMMERMDLKVSQLTWDREWGANTWGFGDFYGKRGHSSDFVLMQKYLDSSMQGPEQFDTMVIYTPLGWNRFTPSAREMIVKRVKERGEGLVLVMPFPGEKGGQWPDDLKELSALINSQSDWMNDGADMKYTNEGRMWEKKWVKTKEHPITAGVPIEALPFKNMELQQYDVAPGAEVLLAAESGQPVMAVKTVGKGRVVTIAARSLSLTPVMNSPRDYPNEIPYRFWEVWYSLENRAILWAAGREFKRDGEPVVLEVEGENKDGYFTVRQWKNAEGKVTDWDLVFNQIDKDVVKFKVTVPEAVEPGSKIPVSFTVPEGMLDGEWSAELGETVDGKWRTMESVPLNAKLLSETQHGPCSFEFSTDRIRQYAAYVKITARKDGETRAIGKAEVIVSPDPKWDDYEIHTWLESGLPFLQDFEERRMREFGLTANTVGPGDMNTCKAMLRAGIRVHGCGFTGGLHAQNIKEQEKQYNATKDKKYLVRNPSYADPEFVASEKKKISEQTAGLMKFRPLSLILSDETSLTSYTMEFDFDFHPENIKIFREKMKAKFGTVENLNAALKTSFQSLDAVEPPTTIEARGAGNWGLWNEWRSHNDDVWTGAFTMYGKTMKEVYPQARVSVSGSQESAIFNGIDWAKLTPALPAISGYGGRFQELQRLSFYPGDEKVTPWGGYGRDGRPVDYQLWESLTTGGDGMGLFWWYSLRNADLTFCKSGKDYQRVFKEMKAGTGKQYMMSKREFSPVAVLWSANSQRAAWTQSKFDEFKKTEAEVVNALHGAEIDPYFISETAVADGELTKRGAKVVVLPMSVSLGIGSKTGGLKVLPELEKFVAGGGTVIATHDVAFDEFLQPATLPETLKGKVVRFADVKDALGAKLAEYGAKPWVTMRTSAGGKIAGMTATAHRIPGTVEAYLLTLLRPPVGMKDVVGADGVIHSVPDKESGNQVETCLVDVSHFNNAHFYDVRQAKELVPSAGKLTIEMQAGDGRPIAVLPYEKPQIDGTVTTQDRILAVNWELKSKGAKGFAQHVVRVDVFDEPTGSADMALSLKVTTGADGKGVAKIPLAIEDVNRKLQVRLTDVLSGAMWASGDSTRRPPTPEAVTQQQVPGPTTREAEKTAQQTPETPVYQKTGVIAGVIAGIVVILTILALMRRKPAKKYRK
jgi:hypothetical protein